MINIEDMEVTTHTTEQPGGINPKKKITVRILHKPTGISATATCTHSYFKARREALKKLKELLDAARKV